MSKKVTGVLDKMAAFADKYIAPAIQPLEDVANAAHEEIKTTDKLIDKEIARNYDLFDAFFLSKAKPLDDWAKKQTQGVERWLSDDNKAIYKELTELMQRETEELRGLPSYKIWQYLLAWGISQKIARQTIWTFPIAVNTSELEARLPDLRYFCKFGLAIYGQFWYRCQKKAKFFHPKTENSALAEYCNIEADVIAFWESVDDFPAHAVMLDHNSQSIVLSIRGSTTASDWILDFQGEYVPFTLRDLTGAELVTANVHKGFLKAAEGISNNCKWKIMEYATQNPGYRLIITGHSLGGGAAGMLALYWYADAEISQLNYHAYPLAPPLIFAEPFNMYLSPIVTSVVFGSDVVGRICFGTVRDLVNLVTYFRRLDQEKAPFRAKTLIKMHAGMINTDINASNDLYNDVKTTCFTNEYCTAPGEVWHMYKQDRSTEFNRFPGRQAGKYKGAFMQRQFYQEIVFSKRMILDHFPDHYENGVAPFVESAENAASPSDN